MAQYYTDFSEYTVATGVPFGWQAQWFQVDRVYSIVSGIGYKGGKALRTSSPHAGNAASLLQWNLLTNDPLRATVEVLCRFRSTPKIVTETNTHSGVAVRGFNTATPSNVFDQRQAGITSLILGAASVSRIAARRITNGAYTTITDPVDFSWNANEWIWTRFRADGNSLKSKSWIGGLESEPEWQIVATDDTYLGAGWIGLCVNAAYSSVHEFDVFSVGTGGDPAPSRKYRGFTGIRGTHRTLGT